MLYEFLKERKFSEFEMFEILTDLLPVYDYTSHYTDKKLFTVYFTFIDNENKHILCKSENMNTLREAILEIVQKIEEKISIPTREIVFSYYHFFLPLKFWKRYAELSKQTLYFFDCDWIEVTEDEEVKGDFHSTSYVTNRILTYDEKYQLNPPVIFHSFFDNTDLFIDTNFIQAMKEYLECPDDRFDTYFKILTIPNVSRKLLHSEELDMCYSIQMLSQNLCEVNIL